MNDFLDSLKKVAKEIEKENIINSIEFRSHYGGLSEENADLIEDIILDGINQQGEEQLLNPIYQIAEQMRRKNVIKSIEFISQYGGLSMESADLIDSYITEYRTKNKNQKKWKV